MKAASHVPEGFRAITPYLIVDGAARYLDFFKAAFGAEEILRMPKEGDRVQHAQLRVGDSIVEVGEQPPDWAPRKAALHLYVPDAGAAYRQALAAPVRPRCTNPRTSSMETGRRVWRTPRETSGSSLPIEKIFLYKR